MFLAALICSDGDCAERFEARASLGQLDALICGCGCALLILALSEADGDRGLELEPVF